MPVEEHECLRMRLLIFQAGPKATSHGIRTQVPSDKHVVDEGGYTDEGNES